jgi:hypothetical protein
VSSRNGRCSLAWWGQYTQTTNMGCGRASMRTQQIRLPT